jgi:hypothetical protein
MGTPTASAFFELTRGDWRLSGGSAGGSPERGRLTTAHEERYRARVEAQRDQLFATAATETGWRLEALGWERIVLVMGTQVAARFRDSLPATVGHRVIATADLNL